MEQLGRQQLQDIMLGATLLGAGGGGSPQNSVKLIEKTVATCPTVEMVSVEEVKDTDLVCVTAGMGSPLAALKRDIVPELIRAFTFMQERLSDRSIQYVLPLEIGGGNTMVPMLVAAHTGARVVDADGAGRSIPQLEMVTFAIYGVRISPLVVADPACNAAVIYSERASEAEAIARAVSSSYANHAGIACYRMTGAELKRSSLAGTISNAAAVGKTIREARAAGHDAAGAVLKQTNGWLLAHGRVARITADTRAGFDFGTVEFAGDGSIALRVTTKNENMIAWRGDRPAAIVPDLICYLDDSGQPLTNADLREGMSVNVLGIKSNPKWRNPEAYGVFANALSQLGYEGEYVPIERLLP